MNANVDGTKSALEYIKSNNLDSLFTELLCSTVHSESEEPIVHMV